MLLVNETPSVNPKDVCYHCGESIPRTTLISVEIDGEYRPMCCPGCAAVAELITSSGLDGFYRQRSAYNERPRQPDATTATQYLVYDDPELAATFTRRDEEGLINASILLGGINCAACTWLIEQSMSAIPGVKRALVQLQQARLDIQFAPQQCLLSDIFTQLDRLGYQPRPFQSSTARQQATFERRAALRRLAVAGLGMMQVGMFAIALHAGDIQGIEANYQALLRWVSLPVASFVVWYSARPFFITAWRHLRQGSLVMDLPVALAIGLAFLASVWATVSGSGQVYFDSVVMFTFLLLLARFLERNAREREQFAWLDAENSLPSAVTVQRNGQWVTVPRMQLQVAETILVNAGETVPVDARVIQGSSAVREDMFNGEHVPRAVGINDVVYAGTLNAEQSLTAQVLVDYRDSRLAALQRSIVQAQTHKPRLAALADRIASWFIAGILLVTALTALVWLQIAPEQALWVALSVLVISCPCALALATPAALTGAATALRARGVIVRGENALEALSRATHLVFDKTGTLTEGTLTLSEVVPLGNEARHDVLAVAAALQRYSTHPAARTFATFEAATDFEHVEYQVGAGVEGLRANDTYRIGSEAFCRELAPDFPSPPDTIRYWIGLCREGVPLAWIALDDRVRPEAAEVIGNARELGLKLALLTGDSSDQGPALAKSLGIEEIHTAQTPQQKMAWVKALQAGGAVVVMVGDGLNDAPVLGIADASFAVAGATDLARSQADFVISGGDLHQLIATVIKARDCRRVIRQNFGWALGYNLCAIPLAACGLIPPWAAAIGMSLSSLLVVANSLRLHR
ncbi:MAG: heavy metal translocating P-type ATPase [Halioglobus sp.]